MWRRGPRVLLLSGGANRGAVQVGMVRSLLEAGWRPDVIVGASAGALNAVQLGASWSPEGLDRLAELWRSADGAEIFAGRKVARLVRILRREGGLHSNQGLERFLAPRLPVARLEDTGIPVRVVVADLHAGRTVSVAAGPALEWLVASCSLPGVLPPVTIGGRLYSDGGAFTPIPLAAALALGPRELVLADASDPVWRRGAKPGALDTLLGAYQGARNEVLRGELEQARRLRRLCWMGVDVGRLPLHDFSHAETLMEAGYQAGRVALARGWRDHGALVERIGRLTVLEPRPAAAPRGEPGGRVGR